MNDISIIIHITLKVRYIERVVGGFPVQIKDTVVKPFEQKGGKVRPGPTLEGSFGEDVDGDNKDFGFDRNFRVLDDFGEPSNAGPHDAASRDDFMRHSLFC